MIYLYSCWFSCHCLTLSSILQFGGISGEMIYFTLKFCIAFDMRICFFMLEPANYVSLVKPFGEPVCLSPFGFCLFACHVIPFRVYYVCIFIREE